jgi:hypothetical protein
MIASYHVGWRSNVLATCDLFAKPVAGSCAGVGAAIASGFAMQRSARRQYSP